MRLMNAVAKSNTPAGYGRLYALATQYVPASRSSIPLFCHGEPDYKQRAARMLRRPQMLPSTNAAVPEADTLANASSRKWEVSYCCKPHENGTPPAGFGP